MADTTFTDGATLVVSAWLQDINNVYYRLTANRIPYATGSALTTSANLTYDGTTLAVGGAVTVGTTLGVTGAVTLSATPLIVGSAQTGTASLQVGPAAPSADGVGRLQMFNTNAYRNWVISHNLYTSGHFEITPSTANGGTTFTTAAFTISGATGAVTIPGTLTVTGAVSIGNTVNAVSPTSPNRTVTISIGGSTYYLHAKTTND